MAREQSFTRRRETEGTDGGNQITQLIGDVCWSVLFKEKFLSVAVVLSRDDNDNGMAF